MTEKERAAIDGMKELARELKEANMTTADLDRLNRRITEVRRTLDDVRSDKQPITQPKRGDA